MSILGDEIFAFAEETQCKMCRCLAPRSTAAAVGLRTRAALGSKEASELQESQREWADVLKGDWDYILKTHNQVVQVLNPEVRAETELLERMDALNTQLSAAHQQVHSSEEMLTKTLDELNQLEAMLDTLQKSAQTPLADKMPVVEPARQTNMDLSRTTKNSSGNKDSLRSTLKIEPELKNFWCVLHANHGALWYRCSLPVGLQTRNLFRPDKFVDQNSATNGRGGVGKLFE